MNYAPLIANGKLYAGAWDGYLHAFDLDTGKRLWKFYSGDSGTETIYGTWPFWNGPIIADGVAFASTGEETPTQPLTRGNRMFAIDDESGDEIWSISGYMSLRAIADGYLVTYNGYDNLMYCFGKGPTKVTLQAPLTAINEGESLMLVGTVTDQSPGVEGTAAISDEDMSDWMEYLRMQKPMPMNVKGVEVLLETLDPNGNFYEIGTVTSDASGMFKMMWEPPVPGEYTVMATFRGSESYWSSHAETAVGVVAAPQPTPPPDPTPAPMTDTYVIGLGVAALIAIIVFGLLILLMLRKR
jgi:hypothetical protein